MQKWRIWRISIPRVTSTRHLLLLLPCSTLSIYIHFTYIKINNFHLKKKMLINVLLFSLRSRNKVNESLLRWLHKNPRAHDLSKPTKRNFILSSNALNITNGFFLQPTHRSKWNWQKGLIFSAGRCVTYASSPAFTSPYSDGCLCL